MPPQTWLVMLRDISRSVRVRGETTIQASLIMDGETGTILATQLGRDADQSLREAMQVAATAPHAPHRFRLPDRIACTADLAPRVARGLDLLDLGQPELLVIAPFDEAEDTFDSLLGHLSGRAQPEEFATPADWRLLIELAWRYHEGRPWERWGDDTDLALDLRIGRRSGSYCAIVLGNEGIQRGLVLYPGRQPPAGLREASGPGAVPTPPGMLVFHLDPRQEPPPEFVAKAERYGWPSAAPLVPVFLAIGSGGPADVGREEVRRLTLAIAATIEIDRLGPVVVERGTAEPVAGQLLLAGGPTGHFAIRQLAPEQPEEGTFELRVHRIDTDLLARHRARVQFGWIGHDALSALRRRAKIHRPFLQPPPRTLKNLPLLAITVSPRVGEKVAAQIATDEPYGLAWAEENAATLVILACAHAAHAIIEVPSAEPGMATFRRRLKTAKGFHAVVVVDAEMDPERSRVYGLFECWMPQAPLPPVGRQRAGR